MSTARKGWVRRALKWLAGGVLAVLLTVCVLAATEGGTRWLIGAVSARIPTLQVDGVSGRLFGELAFERAQWRDDNVQIQALDARLDVSLTALLWQQLRARRLHVETLDVRIAAANNGTAGPDFNGLDLGWAMDLGDVRMNQLRVRQADAANAHEINALQLSLRSMPQQAHWLEIRALDFIYQQTHTQLTGRINLRNFDYRFSNRIQHRSDAGAFNAVGTIHGNADTVHSEQRVDIERPDLTAELQVNADFDVATQGLQAHLQSHAIDVPGAADVGLLPQQLQLSMNGPVTALQWQLILDAEHRADPGAPLHLSAHGTWLDFALLRIDAHRLSHRDGVLEGHSQVDLNTWHVTTDTRIERLALDWLQPLWPQTWLAPGAGDQLDGQVQGSFDWQQKLAHIDALQLEGQFAGQALSVQLQGRLQGLENGRIEGLVRFADDVLEGEIQAQPGALAYRLDARIANLGLWLAGTDGALNVQATGSGPPQQLSSRLRIDSEGLRWDVLQAEGLHLQATADINARDWRATRLDEMRLSAQRLLHPQLEAQALQLQLSGDVQQQQSELSVRMGDVPLQLALSHVNTSDGQRFEISRLELRDARLQGHWSLERPAVLLWGDRGLQLTHNCLRNQGSDARLCVAVESADAGERMHRFTQEFHAVPLSWLNPWLPDRLRLSGQLQGQGEWHLDATGQPVDGALEVRIESGAMQYPDPISETLRSVAIDEARLEAQQRAGEWRLRSETAFASLGQVQAELTLAGLTPAASSAIEGTARVDLTSAEILTVLSDQIGQVQGQLRSTAHISGTLGAPRWQFSGALQDGQVALPAAGIELSHIEWSGSADESGAMALTAAANSGEGTLRAHGEGRFTGLHDWRLDGTVKGQNFQLIKHPEIHLIASPELTWRLQPTGLDINGQVDIPDAAVKFSQLPESAVSQSEDVAVIDRDHLSEGPPESDFDVRYRITARLNRPMDFQALGLKSQITGQLTVDNAAGDGAKGQGQIDLQNGEYTLYGQKLEIKTGHLYFDGELDDPAIDVTATRRASQQDITAGVHISGRASALNSSLFSEPATTELDTLSILVSGRPASQLGKGSGDQLSGAALLLGLTGSTSLFSQIKNTLGVDVFTVKSGANGEGNALEAGKYLNKDIYIGYAYGIFNRSGLLILNYRLSQRLSLQSEYGEGHSVDLIYKVEK